MNWIGASPQRPAPSMSPAYLLAAFAFSISLLSLAVSAGEWPEDRRIQTKFNRKLTESVGGVGSVGQTHTPPTPPSQSPPTPPSPSPPAGNVNVPKVIPWQVLTREFVRAHNKFRTPLQLPPLTWNKTLTRYARRWGQKRFADCKMIHSYGPYGENLFWGKHDHWTPTKVVNSWAAEKEFYNLHSNECAAGHTCGHYTQLMWKESLRLGCARIKCLNGELLFICEYDPAGNYVNEKPF